MVEHNPELEAMIELHKVGEKNNSPVLEGVCGDIVVYGVHDGEVNYSTVGRFSNDGISTMKVGNLLNYVGKSKVTEAEVGDRTTQEVTI